VPTRFNCALIRVACGCCSLRAQVVMAGVLGIYGLIIAVIIANAVTGVAAGRPAYGFL